MKKKALLTIVLISIFFSGCTKISFEKDVIFINGKELKVEIADNDVKWKRGLMFRKKLGDIEGMLFVFDRVDYHGFWMKNTYIPLEILFINDSLRIVDIDRMVPLDTTPHFPVVPVRYVLELKNGSINKYKIKIGDKIIYKKWR